MRGVARGQIRYHLARRASALLRRDARSTAAAPLLRAPEHRRDFLNVRFYSSGPSQEIVVPSLGGESISEGSMMEWKKQIGDVVKKDEVIALIETDKVSIEVNAPADGVMEAFLVNLEDTVTVGMPIAKLAPAGASVAPSAAASATPSAAPKA